MRKISLQSLLTLGMVHLDLKARHNQMDQLAVILSCSCSLACRLAERKDPRTRCKELHI